ncbi:hypothetical protein [Blastococcus sp. LR1]|uniref:hypothetical protein n=1 Tax=Blastococcus sp. LR1 TaxID=2877000 RepID=UPI001CC9A92C|nr:hypothetical protein [Blastococcus sp. LR1]MCA0144239.1 hypothetical protein [Blastococcus sp. LR1]
MTVIRRAVTVLGLALAVVIGTGAPASATFSEMVKLPTPTTLTTTTVAAPTNVRVQITCPTLYSMEARVTWTASSSARVSGYVVNATVAGQTLAASTGPTQTTVTYSTGRSPGLQVSVTVNVLTDYGWSKVSAPVVVTTC